MSRPESTPPLLEMRGISKTFPGVRALDKVRISVWPGEVHSLMGENGAGKSPLMKILSGAYQADPGGEIVIDGKTVVIDGPLVARELGVAVIYQELSLAPNLSVAENIHAGRELRRGGRRFGMVDRAAMARGCEDVLKRLGATFGPTTLVGSLSIAERQLVEIARAVHSDARIIVMDEPTTPLSSRETERLFKLIRQLKAEGIAVIYISHRMAEIYELSDRVSVLRDGAYVGTLMREELNAESLVRMMVGRDISGFYKKEHAPYDPGHVVLTVRDVADHKRVRGCSLDLHSGEVLGIAGLVGAGRTELARLIFGAEQRERGEITIDGRKLHLHGPRDAIEAGLVYLTEDRKHQGLFLDMSVRDNINVAVAGRDARFGVLDLARGSSRAKDSIRALSIRVPSARVNVGALSGGNQQKVLLARWLATEPKLLILDEPTRGIDVAAKFEIMDRVRALCAKGLGILFISSEIAEVVRVSDRIAVLRDRRKVAELNGHGHSEDEVYDLIAGGHR
jgi:ribose transport system ATP-binding protein